MIRAWILYEDLTARVTIFEERDGERFDANDPTDWGLPNDEDYYIILVLQKAQFLGAWVEGERKDVLH